MFAAGSGARTAVCGPQSRIGNLAVAVLAKASIAPDPVTVGVDCQDDALQQVANGTRDAALVFRSDLTVPSGVTLPGRTPR